MALSSNINFYFDCKIRLFLIVNGRQEKKYIFAQENFNLQGILDEINEQDTFFLDCKHKHMMKSSTWGPVPYGLPIEIHGFTNRINSTGYHSMVPGLVSII